ncbi:DUF5819 family protein [Streptomyces chattanoogensis]|uniref:DUF5819 family protein n=1 Tax=Streptomyces chattanoogensis TaxID=66876 RepID=UPI0036BA9D65
MSIIVLAVVGVVVGAALHLAMIFLNIAPVNSLSQEHVPGIYSYVSPDFAQGWKLFAPNPQSVNTHVQARATVLMPDGSLTTTSWVDLSAMDDAQIVHDPFPSQVHQNELSVAWENFVSSRDNQGRSVGEYGILAQKYLLRVVAHRLGPHRDGGTVLRIQLRSADTPVGTPPWMNKHTDTGTSYQVLPWWAVKSEDFQ